MSDRQTHTLRPDSVAAEIDAEIRSLPVRNTLSVRAIRRRHSGRLRGQDAELVLEVARVLLKEHGRRWVAYEIIAHHPAAFRTLGAAELVELGQGIHSWSSVDAFARTLSGPAWLRGQVSDGLIHSWARSPDRWWRRAALVSTVALNMRSHGGPGDLRRTLDVCRLLLDDGDDMVVKAMSWALRQLVVHDAQAVQHFLEENEERLAPRILREVRNKLVTGLKNPGRREPHGGAVPISAARGPQVHL